MKSDRERLLMQIKRSWTMPKMLNIFISLKKVELKFSSQMGMTYTDNLYSLDKSLGFNVYFQVLIIQVQQQLS